MTAARRPPPLIRVILRAAKPPTLVTGANPIRRQPPLRRPGRFAIFFAAPLRLIAEMRRAAVVPKARRIIGHTVEDFEMDIGMLKPDAHELRQIFRLHPDRQAPLVDRHVGDIADAQTGDAQTVLVGIERTERLAERLAHAVAAVRPDPHIDADALRARIETDGVTGRRA